MGAKIGGRGAYCKKPQLAYDAFMLTS